MKLRPLALATFALASAALAQPQPPVTPEARTQFKEQIKEFKEYMKNMPLDAFVADVDEQLLRMPAGAAFLANEFGHSREIVKNAPYTAEAITESIQVLPDGNRIVNKSTTLLARDTAGRTRLERKGSGRAGVYVFDPMDGRVRMPVPPEPPAPPTPPAAATPPTPPAAGSNVDVQPGRVIVRRNRTVEGGTDQNVQVEVVRIGRDSDAVMPPPVPMPPLTLPILPRGKGETKSLGTREFDGIKAEGTMTSHTIPAGQIGNEKPIVITSERWFSPELFIVVYAKTSDPRAGETTYRVTNVKRGEPPAELFAVPERRTRGERRS